VKRRALLACLLALVPLRAAAVTDSATVDAVRQILSYGIDSQVADVLQTLSSAWDPVYVPQLVAILTDKRSTALQASVLDILRSQSVKDGEAAAKSFVDAWEEDDSALVVAAVRYLAAIHSAGLAAALGPVIDSTDSALSSAAISALGSLGTSDSTTLLLAKLASAEYPDARKPEIILALGSLKDKAAVDALMAIAKNTDEDQIRRLYAADALGKIGDPKALPVLRDMFAEKQALVRQYAASALARFGLDEVFDSLIQALRDEDGKVREASANALARSLSPAQAAAAVPILSFKAEMDPLAQVRLASIKALGEIGGEAAIQKLLAVYSSNARPLDSRETALTVLAAKALSRSLDAIRKVIDDEWKTYDPRTLESTAKVLSTTRAAELKGLLVHLLDSTDPVTRSYGARGIALNGFADMKARLSKIAETDSNPGTRREADLAAAKL
jgi:hypothetical protein